MRHVCVPLCCCQRDLSGLDEPLCFFHRCPYGLLSHVHNTFAAMASIPMATENAKSPRCAGGWASMKPLPAPATERIRKNQQSIYSPFSAARLRAGVLCAKSQIASVRISRIVNPRLAAMTLRTWWSSGSMLTVFP